jgi:tartronate-semialdehyde synthase
LPLPDQRRRLRVPVEIEFILERVTNIAMSTEINSVNEFEGVL